MNCKPNNKHVKKFFLFKLLFRCDQKRFLPQPGRTAKHLSKHGEGDEKPCETIYGQTKIWHNRQVSTHSFFIYYLHVRMKKKSSPSGLDGLF
ncbi:hypothetical protein HMPREF0083_05414 [Aneurinibacillus aneurinilyticus ATCC 12856]|uniref:Uncharacterized protein n=1 Tax=Aneurinibacillus aneurinilyticus ATCC 12856 TaxID=649747 RepID=U1Y589_ANEAE|nr:hypothetical protein HMPREF0083_05414 [Aneurinibacillus aneurinilyticus ATCC 12856]